MYTEVRTWSKTTTYPHGAYVLYTEDREMRDIAKRWKDFGGIQIYYKTGGKGAKEMGWDLIFPRPGIRKHDESLKKRLLACCEEKQDGIN